MKWFWVSPIAILGLLVAATVLMFAFSAGPVQASGPACSSGPCDYYSGGVDTSSTCGDYNNNTTCGCKNTSGDTGQTQTACKPTQ
jgi:hypothetical protein